MPNHLSLAKSVFDGTLELICPEMKLMVCPSYAEIALQGVGVIRSDEHGRLYFRMAAPFNGACHDVLRPSRPPGELYKDHDHVMLRATDQDGREWSSEWLIVDLSQQIPLSTWRVKMHVGSLFWSSTRQHQDKSYTQVLIPGLTTLPFDTVTKNVRSVGDKRISWKSSLDHHTHIVAGSEVTFRQFDGDWLSISGERDGPHMPTWPGLVLNALEFMKGRDAPAALVSREFNDREDLQLCSGPFWRLHSFMPGPVHDRLPEHAADFWTLFEFIVAYLDANQDTIGPVLNELAGVRRGAQGSIETACLTLAVGIESLTRLLLGDEQTKTIDKDDLHALKRHLKSWRGDSDLIKRAEGAVGRLAEVSPADRLYAWAQRTGVDASLVDDWKKLRGIKAHGRSPTQKQVCYDLYYSGVELLHRMVAGAVGYTGPIIPTSKRGWEPGDNSGDVPDRPN